jgi:hypothetical protein
VHTYNIAYVLVGFRKVARSEAAFEYCHEQFSRDNLHEADNILRRRNPEKKRAKHRDAEAEE